MLLCRDDAEKERYMEGNQHLLCIMLSFPSISQSGSEMPLCPPRSHFTDEDTEAQRGE